MKFSYRKYQAGDEVAINELYHAVTGRTRSVKEHAWQWLQTPAGESEMWLIEAELKKGEKKLIGHHGVMALEFFHYGKAMRVGKTENTMVLPEFREKILYPRFEKKFLSSYENKFDALFSTTGPLSAICLRKAMGYDSLFQWQNIILGTEPLISIIHGFDIVSRKIGLEYSSQWVDVLKKTNLNSTEIRAYSDTAILKASFDFDAFWDSISIKYPLTPSRHKKNLLWRFWNNPYRQHITLLLNDKSLGIAVCILSSRKKHAGFVEDIYCENLEYLPSFLKVIHLWAKKNLALFLLEFHTTSDVIKSIKGLSGFNDRSCIQKIIHKRDLGSKMPRRIISAENSMMDASDMWFVTPFYFEGR